MMTVRKPTEEDISKTKNWGVWSKEISEFDWYYDDKETCFILEGSATVTADNGESVNFEAGDWVVFEQGLKCVWKITKPIKKKYFFG